MRKIYLLALLIVFTLGLIKAQNVTYQTLHTGSTFDNRAIDQNLTVGSLAASPSVSGSGGANYSIPIAVPPGTNEIAPSVSIQYNSQSSSGVAGMGWEISGLSAIVRVARDMYHDTYTNPVELTLEDRFALDGQRLISKSGTYGTNNATYGTESENFSAVTSFGSGAGLWFKVISKDGVEMEYGNSADSKLLDAGGTEIISIKMNKVKYPDGNYVEFKYTGNFGDSRIDEINYTGNEIASPVLLPYNKIKFNYKLRSDLNTVYQAGTPVFNNYLLDNVTVTADGSTFKTYQFNYGWDNINSYLKEVVESGSDNSTLNSTIFKYGDAPVEFQSGSSGIVAGQSVDLFPGDFDADGYTDVMAATYQLINSLKYHTGFKIYKRTPGNATYTSSATITLPSSLNYTILEKRNL
jgi:hypothetical protein